MPMNKARFPPLAPVEYIPRIRDNYDRLGYAPYKWIVNEDPPPPSPRRRAPSVRSDH